MHSIICWLTAQTVITKYLAHPLVWAALTVKPHPQHYYSKLEMQNVSAFLLDECVYLGD